MAGSIRSECRPRSNVDVKGQEPSFFILKVKFLLKAVRLEGAFAQGAVVRAKPSRFMQDRNTPFGS